MPDVPDVTPEMRHRVLMDDLAAILVDAAKASRRQHVPEAFVPDLMCLQQEVLRQLRNVQAVMRLKGWNNEVGSYARQRYVDALTEAGQFVGAGAEAKGQR